MKANPMANSTRLHPDAIFVRFTGEKGFGFTYLDEEAFSAAADHFLAIALAREEDSPEVRRQVCHDQLWRVFAEPTGEQYTWQNVRWIAAAAVRDKFGYDAAIPRVVMVENAENDESFYRIGTVDLLMLVTRPHPQEHRGCFGQSHPGSH